MDFTSVDSVYENLLSAQNFFALHEQQQLDKQNLIDMANSAVVDLDMYRFENGGGDARGALLLGEDYCRGFNDNSIVDTTAAITTETSTGTETETGTETAGTSTETGSTIIKSLLQPKEKDMNKDKNETAGSMNGFEMMTIIGNRLPDCFWPTDNRQPRPAPTIQINDENFILRLNTIFVLGMRQNVTKNDIIMYFGKMGHIKIDELTFKPKIFVYKNKMTGRSTGEGTITYTSPYAAQAAIHCLDGSKFLGQVLSVVPAYLSTRPGKSVRFTYAQEPGLEQQRRQRQKKWKPAADNWVCELCRNSNFVWRLSCNRCRVSKDDAVTLGQEGTWRPRKHDWTCGYCYNINFWYRQKCNRCSSPKAELLPSSESDKDKWELVVSQTSVV